MARVHQDESDDELPALADLLRRRRPASSNPTTTPDPAIAERAPSKHCATDTTLIPKVRSDHGGSRRQRILKPPSSNNKLMRPVSVDKLERSSAREEKDASGRDIGPAVKPASRRTANKPTKYRVDLDIPEGDAEDKSESGEDVEESLWCGSESSSSDESVDDVDSGDESPRLNSSRRPAARATLKGRELPKHRIPPLDPPRTLLFPAKRTMDADFADTTAPPTLKKPPTVHSTSDRPSSSSSADHDVMLRYSPPRRASPHKVPENSVRPCTPPPPTSPSKSGLNSPSKKIRIPTPPHRPSIDAFWSQEVINTWNDQHSPRKTLMSPRKQLSGSARDNDQDCPLSPQKRSPTKKDQNMIQARKSFEKRKHQLADEFLEELDKKITGGTIAEMAAETGGVKLVWSKTLNTTAGRANWRREGTRVQENGNSVVRYKHHASIELAEKVIDDEDRLVNVIAHEYCHLANFMISNVRDNPHGKEFKEWAKRVTRSFGHRNINVTTKHSYAIDYKYVWTCVSCGHEFKRHSKSIDPAKHRCGSCKSDLVQTKPAVRQKDPSKGPSEYQVFMKENFQRIKRENEGKVHGVIMEMLGKEYREMKAKKTAAPGAGDMASVTKALDTIVLDD